MKNEITQKLISLAEPKYAEFNRKLCPDTKKEILGIRLPKLRTLAKEIIKNYDYLKYLNEVLPCKDKYFEETMLQGFLVAYAKISMNEKFKYIKKFVPKIDSWAICDSFCATIKPKPNELQDLFEFILPFTKSKKEFEARFPVILMIDNFINEEYVDRVIPILDEIALDKYYVQMGVAWALAEVGAKFYDKAMAYLNGKNNLDKFTYNKTLQKMIESNKIDNDTKILLKSMKKK